MDAAVERRLLALWERPHTFGGWIRSVDHKDIGKRFPVTAFLFLLLGGVEALLIRIQLARPNLAVLTPEAHPLCPNTWRNGKKLGDENAGAYATDYTDLYRGACGPPWGSSGRESLRVA